MPGVGSLLDWRVCAAECMHLPLLVSRSGTVPFNFGSLKVPEAEETGELTEMRQASYRFLI